MDRTDSDYITEWSDCHIGMTVDIITKGHVRVVGILLGIDRFGNLSIEEPDNFGDSSIVQRSSLDVMRPYKDQKIVKKFREFLKESDNGEQHDK